MLACFIAQALIALFGAIFAIVSVCTPLAKTPLAGTTLTLGVSSGSIVQLQNVASGTCNNLADVSRAYIASAAISATMLILTMLANIVRLCISATRRDIIMWCTRTCAVLMFIFGVCSLALMLTLYKKDWCGGGSFSTAFELDVGGIMTILAFICCFFVPLLEVFLDHNNRILGGGGDAASHYSGSRFAVAIPPHQQQETQVHAAHSISPRRSGGNSRNVSGRRHPHEPYSSSPSGVVPPPPPIPFGGRAPRFNRNSNPAEVGLGEDFEFNEETGLWHSKTTSYLFDHEQQLYYETTTKKWFDPHTNQWVS